MADYPKCLYRDGGSYEWDGRLYDVRLVADEKEEKQAAADGWATAEQVLNSIADPLGHDGDGEKGGSLPRPVPRRAKRKG